METFNSRTDSRSKERVSGVYEDNLDLFKSKNKNVICINGSASLIEAAKLMFENHIGDLVVLDERDDEVSYPIGMITDRDIVINTLGQGLNPENFTVADVMTRSMTTCNINDDVFKMATVMKDKGVSRLPLVDDNGEVQSIITAKNLLQNLASCLNQLTHLSDNQQANERN